jgi:hypothetical protein
MQCKCAIVTNQKPDYGQFYIKFCPMHEAAPQLVEFAERVAGLAQWEEITDKRDEEFGLEAGLCIDLLDGLIGQARTLLGKGEK